MTGHSDLLPQPYIYFAQMQNENMCRIGQILAEGDRYEHEEIYDQSQCRANSLPSRPHKGVFRVIRCDLPSPENEA